MMHTVDAHGGFPPSSAATAVPLWRFIPSKLTGRGSSDGPFSFSLLRSSDRFVGGIKRYRNVRELLAQNDDLARIILPLLEAWRDIRKPAADLDRQLLAVARQSQPTKLLMTTPGIGAVTAVSYIAAIEGPENFKTSRSVGAWLGCGFALNSQNLVAAISTR